MNTFRYLFFILFPFALAAQTIIKGVVTDAEGAPLSLATLQLYQGGLVQQTSTTTDGSFQFDLSAEGNFRLHMSAAGFETRVEAYMFKLGDRYDLGTLALSPKIHYLQAVEVIGREQTDYLSDYSFSATKVAIPNKQLPQALTAVTKELIADRQAFQLADAVKAVSGVSPSSVYNQYNIRGISQNEEGQIINGLRTRQYYFLQPLTSHVERVEVLKGPASVSFSSVDPGGSINLVTKKPLPVERKELMLGAGSYSTLRGALDFTGPINESKTLLYRLNIGFQRAQSYRDLIQNNALLFTPSISYVPDDSTAFNIELIYSNSLGNLDRGQPIFGAQAGVTDLNSTPIGLNLGATNDYFESEEWMLMANFSKQINKSLGFHSSYMKQTWNEDLREHRTTNAFAVDIDGNAIPTLASMRYIERQQFWDIDNLNAYFSYDIDGTASHKFVFGYDLHRWNKTDGGGQNQARGYLLNDGSITNTFDLERAGEYQTITHNGLTLPKPNVAHFNLANPTNAIRDKGNYTLNSQFAIPAVLSISHAAYVQHFLEVGRFSALLSLRYEWFSDITNYDKPLERTFENTALLPRIGLTYALNAQLNIYATYLEGYQPQSNTVTLMPSTGIFFWDPNSPARFDPLESDLIELGMKGEFWGGAVQSTLSVYQIQQKNILISANSVENPDLLTQRGADRSRGVEWELAGFVLPNLQLNASYSYIDAEIRRDDDVSLIGTRKENTPVHSANLWGRWDFRETKLQDFGLGLGMQHSGSKIPWFTRDFTVPGYTIFDMAIYYRPKSTDIQLSLKVNNLLNETYRLGAQTYFRLFPGAPRNTSITATYKF